MILYDQSGLLVEQTIANQIKAYKLMFVSNLNLDSPPGFRGLNPDMPLNIYHRKLPHWRQVGATYFVTFRLADSIPQEQLRALKRWRRNWELSHPEPRSNDDWSKLAREITSRTDAWMDDGYGECIFRNPEMAAEMSKSLLHFQHQRVFTSCFVVMPNHVHAVMRPNQNADLEDLLGGIKRFVSNKINRTRERNGPVWERESYDRIVRDENHLYEVIQYIGRNPRKAGLPKGSWHRWIEPEWENQGWGFRDD